MTRRAGPAPPPLPGRPPRPGEAEPHAGRRRPARRRLPLAALGLRAADPRRSDQPGAARRRPGHAPRHRARRRARRPTTSSSARWRRRAPRSAAAGRAVPAPHRPSRRGSTSASPSRPAWPAAPRTPRPPSTAPSRHGAPSSTSTPATRVAAHLGSDVPFFLAGGPALVEGRGEQVAPLHGLHGAPGVVLVTPAVAVSTPDVFAAFDAIRTHGDGAVRMSSTHLAEELRSGLTRRQSRRTGRRPRLGQRPPAGDLARRSGAGPVQARPEPAARPPDRPVGLRPDPLGALSFGDRRGGRRRGRPRGPGRRPPRLRRARAHPFVVASAIVSHSQEGSAA